MGGEWRILSLKDAPLEIIDGDRGSNYPKQSQFSAHGHCLFLNAGNVTQLGFNFSDCAFITRERDSLLRKGKLARRDVVLTTRGTVGNSAYFDESVPFDDIRINSGMVILRANQVDLDPLYVYLFVRSHMFHSQVAALQTGSAQPQLPVRDINRIEMPLPPLSEQRAITELLGSLDDKIELNRRMNRALEKMARALFKAWFTDFEPVRAKAGGATDFPGMPQNVFDELPNRLSETDLGPIPEGWTVGVLGDAVQERKDRVQPSPETRSLPYVPIDCITSKSLWLEHSKSGDDAKSSLVSFDEDDILFGAMRPYFHKVCLAPFAGTTRTTVFILRPKVLSDLSFSLLLLSETATVDYATQHSVGSTIPYAKWDNSLATMPIICPPPHLRGCFHDIVWPMLELLKRPYFENRVLGAIRDALLPKLISGEIRLTEDGEVQHGG